MFTVQKHTAPMTGALWFIVTEDNNGIKVEGTEFYSDYEDAEIKAQELNNPVVRLAAHLGYGEVKNYHDGPRFMLTEHFAEQLLYELTGENN